MTSREKFEAWYLENWGCTEDNHDSLFEESPHGGEYYRFGVRLAWESWQAASKASEQQLEESRREFRAADTTIHNLELKITDMAVQLANAESKCRELAAENAGLKSTCDDRRTFIMNGVQLGYIKVPTVETDPALETIRVAVSPQEPTPATDAFLAEVRAQGVEMYADTLDRGADDAECGGFDDGVKFLRAEAAGVREFAAQLRMERG